MNIRVVALAAIVGVVALSSSTLAAQAAPRAVDRSNMDTTCAPCTDFYRFVNGKWLDTATIPASYPGIGVGREVYDRSLDVLHEILEQAAKDKSAAPNSNTQKLGAFYGACLDSAKAEKLDAAPMAAELERIAAITTPALLQAEFARLQADGVDIAFGVGTEPDFKNTKLTVAAVGQGGLGLPDREYYLNDDSASVKLRDAYRAHVARTLELLGDTPAKAADAAKRVLALADLHDAAEQAGFNIIMPVDAEKVYGVYIPKPHRLEVFFHFIGNKAGVLHLGESGYCNAAFFTQRRVLFYHRRINLKLGHIKSLHRTFTKILILLYK